MKRSQQKTEDTWDLQSVFQDEASWQEDYDRTLAAIVGLETYRGRMASSDDVLFEALCTLEKVALELEKVCTYASLSYECNAIDGAAQRMAGLASSLEAHGLTYEEMLKVLGGDDRYAREMLTYRLKAKRLEQEAAEQAASAVEEQHREEELAGV